jgi:hypothetical protein
MRARWSCPAPRSANHFNFSVELRTRCTTDRDIRKVRAMAAGLTPAFNDARMRFAVPSGILSIPVSLLLRIVADWPCDDALVGAAGALSFLRPRRLISMVTAASSRSSWASSRYFSDPERSLGSVTRAGDGAPIDDGDEARDDGPGTDDEAWFCRSDPRITQECRTTMIGAISLGRNRSVKERATGRSHVVRERAFESPSSSDDTRELGPTVTRVIPFASSSSL